MKGKIKDIEAEWDRKIDKIERISKKWDRLITIVLLISFNISLGVNSVVKENSLMWNGIVVGITIIIVALMCWVYTIESNNIHKED